MRKWSLTRVIATCGCIIAALSLSVFLILATDRVDENYSESDLPFVNARMITPKTFGSYGELMFAYVGNHNYLYNLDDESAPIIEQPVKELLYASDDSVLYTASCELDIAHLGRESVIQELQIGEQENRLNTIAKVTVDPCWSSNDEVIYYVEDTNPVQLCTFEPLTSTSEVAAEFDDEITGLRISSDGLLVTLKSGAELLYVPLSKQLVDPGISTKGNIITVCEQYDLFLSPEGTLSYHWQGSDELVKIADDVLIGISHQDNEIYYIQRNADGVRLMDFIVSEEQHHLLAALDNFILPQLTVDADFAFVINEQGVVYRFDIQNGTISPYHFVDMDSIKSPLISLFDYRLMIYDLSKEPDATFCYSLPCDLVLSDEELEQNQERATEILEDNVDYTQNQEFSYMLLASTGENVTALQTQLNALGYLNCEPTGVYGVETMYAVMQAQTDLGLDVTGIANRLFQTLLSICEPGDMFQPISFGDSGFNVRNLEARMATLGYSVTSFTSECDNNLLKTMKLYCAHNGFEFEDIITPEIQQSAYMKDSPVYTGYIDLRQGDFSESAYALNARLHVLGYSEYSPRPCIDSNSITALMLFAEINDTEMHSVVTSALQEMLFSEEALPCPTERRPASLSEMRSSTEGQVITDRQLKILRKWLTKSFAINHTDRQAVKRLQIRLKHLGYLSEDSISMIYDKRTADAICSFQTDNGLSADGVPTKKTLMELFGISNSTLSGE